MNKLYDICPVCGLNLDGGEIFPILREQDHFKGMSDDELSKYISETYLPPYHWSKAIGIELENDRYYQCPECQTKL